MSPNVLPFYKVCRNCHGVDIIVSPFGNVHCNAYHMKLKVEKSSFLSIFIATSDELVLLTIEGKWLIIANMPKFTFFNFLHRK
jgi:hypothetical protein